MQQLQGGTAGQCTMEEPPGQAGWLGLARWLSTKQCFGELPIMYMVTGLLSTSEMIMKRRLSSSAKMPKLTLK